MSWKLGSRHESLRLKRERNQRGHFLHKAEVFLGEFPRQQGFLPAVFDDECNHLDGYADESVACGGGDGTAQRGQQKTGVNRVAYETVGAGADDSVAFFQRDISAPIFTQMKARPNGKEQADEGEEGTEPFGGIVLIEPADKEARAVAVPEEEEIETDCHWQ